MLTKKFNNTGVTLLEILISSIIFVTAVAGIFVTLNAVRGPVANKENQLAAAVFGKQLLEYLYAQVDYNTYYSTACVVSCPNLDLEVGTHNVPIASLPPLPIALQACYPGGSTLNYTVSCADGSSISSTPVPCNNNSSIAHSVNMNILWPNVETGVCT